MSEASERLRTELAGGETIIWPEIAEDIAAVIEENATLMDLLVSVTHHDGALDEYRPQWEPIVVAELKRRLQPSVDVDTGQSG